MKSPWKDSTENPLTLGNSLLSELGGTALMQIPFHGERDPPEPSGGNFPGQAVKL